MRSQSKPINNTVSSETEPIRIEMRLVGNDVSSYVCAYVKTVILTQV